MRRAHRRTRPRQRRTAQPPCAKTAASPPPSTAARSACSSATPASRTARPSSPTPPSRDDRLQPRARSSGATAASSRGRTPTRRDRRRSAQPSTTRAAVPRHAAQLPQGRHAVLERAHDQPGVRRRGRADQLRRRPGGRDRAGRGAGSPAPERTALLAHDGQRARHGLPAPAARGRHGGFPLRQRGLPGAVRPGAGGDAPGRLHAARPDPRRRTSANSCARSTSRKQTGHRLVVGGPLPRRNGRRGPLAARRGPPGSAQGGDTLWDGLLLDITTRKRAEQEIRDRARQAAAVAELGQRALASSGLPRAWPGGGRDVITRTLGMEMSVVTEMLPGERGADRRGPRPGFERGLRRARRSRRQPGRWRATRCNRTGRCVIGGLAAGNAFPGDAAAGSSAARSAPERGHPRPRTGAGRDHRGRGGRGSSPARTSISCRPWPTCWPPPWTVRATNRRCARARRATPPSWKPRSTASSRIDHEGRIVEFNPAAEKTFGCTRARRARPAVQRAGARLPPDELAARLRDLPGNPWQGAGLLGSASSCPPSGRRHADPGGTGHHAHPRRGPAAVHRLPARHHRAQAHRGRAQPGQGRSREGQPRQERIPLAHEPRAAHAAQRHPRLRPDLADAEAARPRRTTASATSSRRAGICSG